MKAELIMATETRYTIQNNPVYGKIGGLNPNGPVSEADAEAHYQALGGNSANDQAAIDALKDVINNPLTTPETKAQAEEGLQALQQFPSTPALGNWQQGSADHLAGRGDPWDPGAAQELTRKSASPLRT